jgi:Outer membrane protein beta-barrel domain
MKKYLTIILLFLSFSTTVFCQKPTFTFGVRSGVNLTNYKYSSDGNSRYYSPKSDRATLFTLGLQSEIHFSKHFALQTELNFIQKGYTNHWEYDGGSFRSFGDSKFVTNWLEIPFLAKVRFGKPTGIGFGLFLGPSIGYALGGRHESSFTRAYNLPTESKSEVIDFNRFNHKRYDFGLNLGGDISYKRIFFDIRYQFSLNNLASNAHSTNTNNSALILSDFDETNISLKTQNLLLTLGYRTPIVKAKSEGPKRRILREIFN